MKKSIVAVILLGGLFFLFQAFHSKTSDVGEIPDDVNKVIESSCFQCHNSGSRNEDARKDLSFDEWDTYRLTKQIGLLGKIEELVGEGKMPPEKFLEHNPDKKLTDEQKQLLTDWAKKESTALMEGN